MKKKTNEKDKKAPQAVNITENQNNLLIKGKDPSTIVPPNITGNIRNNCLLSNSLDIIDNNACNLNVIKTESNINLIDNQLTNESINQNTEHNIKNNNNSFIDTFINFEKWNSSIHETDYTVTNEMYQDCYHEKIILPPSITDTQYTVNNTNNKYPTCKRLLWKKPIEYYKYLKLSDNLYYDNISIKEQTEIKKSIQIILNFEEKVKKVNDSLQTTLNTRKKALLASNKSNRLDNKDNKLKSEKSIKQTIETLNDPSTINVNQEVDKEVAATSQNPKKTNIFQKFKEKRTKNDKLKAFEKKKQYVNDLKVKYLSYLSFFDNYKKINFKIVNTTTNIETEEDYKIRIIKEEFSELERQELLQQQQNNNKKNKNNDKDKDKRKQTNAIKDKDVVFNEAKENTEIKYNVPNVNYNYKKKINLMPSKLYVAEKQPLYTKWLSSIFQNIIDLNILDCYDKVNIIKKIYPQNEFSIPFYNIDGHYWVKLYYKGSCVKVDIDDRAPIDCSFEFAFPRCDMIEELWPSILTKALIKLYSSIYINPNYEIEAIGDSSLIYSLTGYLGERCIINKSNNITFGNQDLEFIHKNIIKYSEKVNDPSQKGSKHINSVSIVTKGSKKSVKRLNINNALKTTLGINKDSSMSIISKENHIKKYKEFDATNSDKNSIYSLISNLNNDDNFINKSKFMFFYRYNPFDNYNESRVVEVEKDSFFGVIQEKIDEESSPNTNNININRKPTPIIGDSKKTKSSNANKSNKNELKTIVETHNENRASIYSIDNIIKQDNDYSSIKKKILSQYNKEMDTIEDQTRLVKQKRYTNKQILSVEKRSSMLGIYNKDLISNLSPIKENDNNNNIENTTKRIKISDNHVVFMENYKTDNDKDNKKRQSTKNFMNYKEILKGAFSHSLKNNKSNKSTVKIQEVETVKKNENTKYGNIFLNYCYSMIDFLDTEGFNLERLKPAQFPDLVEQYKKLNNTDDYKTLSPKSKKAYKENRRKNREEIKKKRDERVEAIKKPGKRELFFKIKSEAIGTTFPFKENVIEEKLEMAKKCIINKWEYPPLNYISNLIDEEEKNKRELQSFLNKTKISSNVYFKKSNNNLNESDNNYVTSSNNNKNAKTNNVNINEEVANNNLFNKNEEKKKKKVKIKNNITNATNIISSNAKNKKNFNETASLKALNYSNMDNNNNNQLIDPPWKIRYYQLVGNNLSIYDNEKHVYQRPSGKWINNEDFIDYFNEMIVLHNPVSYRYNLMLNIDDNRLDCKNKEENNYLFVSLISDISQQSNNNNIYNYNNKFYKDKSCILIYFEPYSKTIFKNNINLNSNLYYIVIDIKDCDNNYVYKDFVFKRLYSCFQFDDIEIDKNYYIIVKGGIFPDGFVLSLYSDHKIIQITESEYLINNLKFNSKEIKTQSQPIYKNENSVLSRLKISLTINNEFKNLLKYLINNKSTFESILNKKTNTTELNSDIFEKEDDKSVLNENNQNVILKNCDNADNNNNNNNNNNALFKKFSKTKLTNDSNIINEVINEDDTLNNNNNNYSDVNSQSNDTNNRNRNFKLSRRYTSSILQTIEDFQNEHIMTERKKQQQKESLYLKLVKEDLYFIIKYKDSKNKKINNYLKYYINDNNLLKTSIPIVYLLSDYILDQKNEYLLDDNDDFKENIIPDNNNNNSKHKQDAIPNNINNSKDNKNKNFENKQSNNYDIIESYLSIICNVNENILDCQEFTINFLWKGNLEYLTNSINIEPVEYIDPYKIKDKCIYSNKQGILLKEFVYVKDIVITSFCLDLIEVYNNNSILINNTTMNNINDENNNNNNIIDSSNANFTQYKKTNDNNFNNINTANLIESKSNSDIIFKIDLVKEGETIFSTVFRNSIYCPYIPLKGQVSEILNLAINSKSKTDNKTNNNNKTKDNVLSNTNNKNNVPYLLTLSTNYDEYINHIKETKMYYYKFVIKLFPTNTVVLVKDNTKEMQEKSLIDNWEVNQPGRSMLAHISKLKYKLHNKKENNKKLTKEEEDILNSPKEQIVKNNLLLLDNSNQANNNSKKTAINIKENKDKNSNNKNTIKNKNDFNNTKETNKELNCFISPFKSVQSQVSNIPGLSESMIKFNFSKNIIPYDNYFNTYYKSFYLYSLKDKIAKKLMDVAPNYKYRTGVNYDPNKDAKLRKQKLIQEHIDNNKRILTDYFNMGFSEVKNYNNENYNVMNNTANIFNQKNNLSTYGNMFNKSELNYDKNNNVNNNAFKNTYNNFQMNATSTSSLNNNMYYNKTNYNNDNKFQLITDFTKTNYNLNDYVKYDKSTLNNSINQLTKSRGFANNNNIKNDIVSRSSIKKRTEEINEINIMLKNLVLNNNHILFNIKLNRYPNYNTTNQLSESNLSKSLDKSNSNNNSSLNVCNTKNNEFNATFNAKNNNKIKNVAFSVKNNIIDSYFKRTKYKEEDLKMNEIIKSNNAKEKDKITNDVNSMLLILNNIKETKLNIKYNKLLFNAIYDILNEFKLKLYMTELFKVNKTSNLKKVYSKVLSDMNVYNIKTNIMFDKFVNNELIFPDDKNKA